MYLLSYLGRCCNGLNYSSVPASGCVRGIKALVPSKYVTPALQAAHGLRLAGHVVKKMLSEAGLYRKKMEGG